MVTAYAPPHLSHHAVPCSIDLLAMFAIGHQIQVVREFDGLGDLLQDVDAEPLTAALDVDPGLLGAITAGIERWVDDVSTSANRRVTDVHTSCQSHIFSIIIYIVFLYSCSLLIGFVSHVC